MSMSRNVPRVSIVVPYDLSVKFGRHIGLVLAQAQITSISRDSVMAQVQLESWRG